MVLSFILVIIPLGFVLYTVVARGASVISWQFLTGSPIPPNTLPATIGGMWPAVLGTLEITGLATLMAVPLGILGAVYLNEYGGKNWLAALIGFMSDVMTGVPSIVMGLFIFSIWVLHFGYSGLAGAFALACLMLPVVIRSSEEMLKLVPDPLREASYALGATKSRVTLTVVLPAAIGGIVSGALLAIARAAGETAPLLFTCALAGQLTDWNPTHSVNSIPLTIFQYSEAPDPALHEQAWALAFVLISFVLITSLTARFMLERSRRKLGAR
jgi:phosphate transport system permease protein